MYKTCKTSFLLTLKRVNTAVLGLGVTGRHLLLCLVVLLSCSPLHDSGQST